MATTAKTKSSARTFTSWTDWFDAVAAKQGELAEVTGIGQVQEKLDRARNGLEYAIRAANSNPAMPMRAYHYHFQNDETPEELATEAKSLADVLSRIIRANDRHASPERDAFARETLDAIHRHRAALDEASAELERLTSQRDAVLAELEALEGQAPKASAASLGDMQKQVEAAEVERDRIAAVLENMDGDSGPLNLAEESEQAARERLEEAEALAALGEAASEDVKAARSAASKAADALAKEQAECRQMANARRGLERKLESAEQTLSTVRAVYRTALDRVRQADLAAREAALVAKVEDLSEDLADLNRIYADLEEATPNASYGTARLEVKMPYLHHHPRRDEIRHGFIITAYGVEE
ncbi:hypothetical protein [Halomonas sp. C05BenzN]|uniref:hypothetical protein n=1 Tax=Halomonas sp. C05BenzN TaxID=3411041 RepID=UPI003B952B02